LKTSAKGVIGRHLYSLCVASTLVASSASAIVACSGGSAHEAADAGKEGASSSDGGRSDSTPPDASGADHRVAPPDAIADGGCALGAYGEAVELQCAGLYSDWPTKTVSPENKAFVPGLQLWSDGAEKNRWVYLPPGQKIDTSNMDEWMFPVGTKLWKEFRLPIGAATTLTRIETRLLWKKAVGTWYRTTYRWSADGETSAKELTSGELDANGNGYEVPAQIECNTCHNGRADGVLGFEALGLSLPSASLVTIATLESDDLLTAPPTSALTVPGDAVQAAALGWLHVNCGTACHNRGSGDALGSGFFTRLDVATLGSVEATDTYTTGWNVQTKAYEIPDASTSYRLHSCDPGGSASYYRTSRRDGVDGTPYGTQMPKIDTHKVDEAGVAELGAWIDESCDGGGATDGGVSP
jgi:hypothetical protein